MTRKMANSSKILIILTAAVFLVSLMAIVPAETTCTATNCEIKITIKIAFSGADNATMDKWKQDIESTWNGYTYGDCGCPVKVSVETKSVQGLCEQNPVPGYHCIDVTADYARDTAGKTYRGYMKGVSQKGSDSLGWWSSHMNEALPGVQGSIHDAAHEAGHMLGLNDDYNATNGTYGENIMGRTWGDKAKPTQAQIDQTVEKNCPADACPKPKCCCGNKKIDTGEQCDHTLDPSGCKAGELCVQCKCASIVPPVCGDGKITGTEECDYNSANKTCNSTYECNNKCKCVKKQDNETGGGSTELKIVITDPDDGDTIDDDTSVKANVTGNESAIEKVKFYMNEESVYTDTEYPWKWTLKIDDFDEGDWTIKVKVYDEDGNTDEDSIDIEIVKP